MTRALLVILSLSILGSLWASPVQAGGFIGPQGSVWTKLSFSQWLAPRKLAGPFDRDTTAGIDLGTPIDFDPSTGGELNSMSFNLDLSVVPLPRTHLGAFFPLFQQVTFEDSTFASTTAGTGDVYLFAGVQLTPTESTAVGTVLNLRLKIPTTDPERGFEFIPLSEGQVDIALEQVTTYAALPSLHLSARTLIRHRRPFEDNEGPESQRRVLKPGDEAELSLEIGGAPFDGLWLKMSYNGLWSTGFEDRSGETLVTLRSRKQVHDVLIGAYFGLGQLIHPVLDGLAVDLWARHPFTGQDYPFGLSYSVGLAYAFEVGG